ncbi:hypothetical protein LTR37_015633 [Vermiconidia calcicola]|uniref:Uncharacterized protein n=1 Tax=Vermiconidia calcicola TaxID=1690605 RepID=A0ACC3MRP1_9PEZI|nr:hypothetical protein LTR37_015633 [Vermiconidia calcicola]
MATFITVMMLFILSTLGLTAMATDPADDTLATWCFHCGDGVDRLDAGIAASAACNYWYNTVMYPDWTGSGGLAFNYGWDGGNIALSVVPFWDSHGCGEFGPPLEFNDYFTNGTRCYYGFMGPIDACDTDSTHGKHGGYKWDYCNTVTINPNPDGCDSGDRKVASSPEAHFPAGVEVATHYATHAEHEAAKAEMLQHPDFATKVISINAAAAAEDDSVNTAPEADDTATLYKRSGLACFDGGLYAECYGVDRDIAMDAIDWFCSSWAGFEIDALPDEGGPISVAANYSYEPEGLIALYPGAGIIDLSLGISLDFNDNSCEDAVIIDYDDCKQGLSRCVEE